MFGKCICKMKSEEVMKHQKMVPDILQLLTSLLNQGNEIDAEKLLQVLIEIASTKAIFFRKHLNDLGKLCQAISVEGKYPPGTKILCLEILCSILESEPQMVRQDKAFIDVTALICFNLLLNIERDSD